MEAVIQLATPPVVQEIYDALEAGSQDLALTKVEEALATCTDVDVRTGVMKAKIDVYLRGKKKPEARTEATEAVAYFRKVDDTAGEAAAHLLVAQVCQQTLRHQESVHAAKEALKLFKALGNKLGQVSAYKAIIEADMDLACDQAIPFAQQGIKMLREMGDRKQEGDVLLLLAKAHVTRLGKKLGICSIPSAEDTMGALKAAKDANALFMEHGQGELQVSAIRIIARALLYNGLEPEVIEGATDPEEIFQEIMTGKYSNSRNALPPAPKPQIQKIEEIIPSAKQLDKGNFKWNDPTAGYCYSLIWQPAKERNIGNNKPRGQYDIMSMVTGSKNLAISAAIAARSNDASERNEPMVVFITSKNTGQLYSTNMVNSVHTVASMITCRVTKMTFVQIGESTYDWTDTAAREVEMTQVTLAIARSARLEAPFLTIGFVGGDAASWLVNPGPMVENIFDVIESEECEVIYKHGEAFAPTIVHKPMEEAINAVKPRKTVKYTR